MLRMTIRLHIMMMIIIKICLFDNYLFADDSNYHYAYFVCILSSVSQLGILDEISSKEIKSINFNKKEMFV